MPVNDILLWVWVGVFVVSIIIEVSTQELVSLWFAIASLPAIILAIFDNVHFGWQIGSFVLVSAGMLFFTRPLIMKKLKRTEYKTNIDSIIGVKGVITKKIEPPFHGEVRINNDLWTAASNEAIKEGEFVTVLSVSGNKLVVEKSIKEEK